MCGIAGFSWKDESLMKAMLEELKHRGPDDEGLYSDDSVTLGHRRLSILDLSHKGHQPMIRDDGKLIIVHNGEIYNYKELKNELEDKGYVFESNTDTEVIIYAYKEWGYDCVKRFNGMWSFAIYDKRKNILFLSRDRFGIKPLYYYNKEGKFIFASEIKAILIHGMPRVPNDRAIFEFLYYNTYDHAEYTFFENIIRLLPGHNLIFHLDNKKIEKIKYYDLRQEIKNKNLQQGDFKEIFLQSIKRRLVADVSVGSCLSGGLDSSSIVCGMRHLTPYSEIKTFSLIFPETEIDESKYQKIVESKCRVSPYKTSFTPNDILNDLFDLIKTQEEPFGSLSIYGQYRVMRLAKENNMKVLLDGQGADEILAGYHYFFGYFYYELFRNFKIRKLVEEILEYRRKYGTFLSVKYFIGLLLPLTLQRHIINKNIPLSKRFIKKFENVSSFRFVKKDLNEALIDAVVYSLPHLLRFEDKNAMRWSIESRVPFLDHELVEFVLALPSKYKINKGWTKHILRKRLVHIVPSEILHRSDKVGFATPDKDLAYSDAIAKLIRDIIESPSFKNRKYWDWKKIHALYEKRKTNKIYRGDIIWKLVILELWFRIFIDVEKYSSSELQEEGGVNDAR